MINTTQHSSLTTSASVSFPLNTFVNPNLVPFSRAQLRAIERQAQRNLKSQSSCHNQIISPSLASLPRNLKSRSAKFHNKKLESKSTFFEKLNDQFWSFLGYHPLSFHEKVIEKLKIKKIEREDSLVPVQENSYFEKTLSKLNTIQIFPGADAHEILLERARRGIPEKIKSILDKKANKININLGKVKNKPTQFQKKNECPNYHGATFYFNSSDGQGSLHVHFDYYATYNSRQRRLDFRRSQTVINYNVDNMERTPHNYYDNINNENFSRIFSNANELNTEINRLRNQERLVFLSRLQQQNHSLEEPEEQIDILSNLFSVPDLIENILNNISPQISLNSTPLHPTPASTCGITNIKRIDFYDANGGILTASIDTVITYNYQNGDSRFNNIPYHWLPLIFSNWSDIETYILSESEEIKRFRNTDSNASCSSDTHSSRSRRSASNYPTNPFLSNEPLICYSSELPPGEILTVGGKVHSHNNLFSLKLESSGRIVLYNATRPDVLWSSQPNFLGDIKPSFVKMHSDGKLILYGKGKNGNICKIWEKTAGTSAGGIGLRVDDNGSIYFKDKTGKVIKRLCSSFLGGMCEGQVCNNLGKAVQTVSMVKNSWGSGVASLVIVKNSGHQCLTVTSASSSHGWFKVKPVSIPPKKLMYFSHVKTTGSATGSQGFVIFNDRFRIGWSTPWSGENRLENINPVNKIKGQILKEGPSVRYDPIYYFEIASHQYNYCENPQNFDDDYGMTPNMAVKEHRHDELKK